MGRTLCVALLLSWLALADAGGVRSHPQRDPVTPGTTHKEQQDELETTRRIRQAIVRSDALSPQARNLTILTEDGVVTLRGTVGSRAEKEKVEALARSVTERVKNEVLVTGE